MTSISVKKILAHLLRAYPVGSMYITSTNTNPSAWLGGTWTLVKKSLAYKWISNPVAFNTTNTQNGASMALLGGDTIEFRLSWEPKVALSDDTRYIGTVNASQLGIDNSQIHDAYGIAYTDGNNAVGLVQITANASTGVITFQTVDWVSRAASIPTGTGANYGCYCSIVYKVQNETQRIDSFCNEFHWKRTA